MYQLRVNYYGLAKWQGSEHMTTTLKTEQDMREECDCYWKSG